MIFNMLAGETRIAEVDWSRYAGRFVVAVDSAEWAVVSGGALISNPTLYNGIAQCSISVAKRGKSEITCTATLSDGQRVIKQLTIIAEDI